MVNKYGELYAKWEGSYKFCTVVVAKPEDIRQILIKDFPSFMNRQKLPFRDNLFDNSLLFLRDQRWRDVRSVVTPSFSSGKMRFLDALIRECLVTLSNAVETEFSNSPNSNQIEIEVKQQTSYFAMDVIGSAFFGMSVDSMKNPDSGFARQAFAVFRPPSVLGILTFSKCFITPTPPTNKRAGPNKRAPI